jgi:hypothetical protein
MDPVGFAKLQWAQRRQRMTIVINNGRSGFISAVLNVDLLKNIMNELLWNEWTQCCFALFVELI